MPVLLLLRLLGLMSSACFLFGDFIFLLKVLLCEELLLLLVSSAAVAGGLLSVFVIGELSKPQEEKSEWIQEGGEE